MVSWVSGKRRRRKRVTGRWSQEEVMRDKGTGRDRC